MDPLARGTEREAGPAESILPLARMPGGAAEALRGEGTENLPRARVVVFVDHDNCQNALPALLDAGPVLQPGKAFVLAFHGPDVPTRRLLRQLNNGGSVVEVESRTGGKNAADVALTFHAAVLHALMPREAAFLIVSGDKAYAELAAQLRASGRRADTLNAQQEHLGNYLYPYYRSVEEGRRAPRAPGASPEESPEPEAAGGPVFERAMSKVLERLEREMPSHKEKLLNMIKFTLTRDERLVVPPRLVMHELAERKILRIKFDESVEYLSLPQPRPASSPAPAPSPAPLPSSPAALASPSAKHRVGVASPAPSSAPSFSSAPAPFAASSAGRSSLPPEGASLSGFTYASSPSGPPPPSPASSTPGSIPPAHLGFRYSGAPGPSEPPPPRAGHARPAAYSVVSSSDAGTIRSSLVPSSTATGSSGAAASVSSDAGTAPFSLVPSSTTTGSSGAAASSLFNVIDLIGPRQPSEADVEAMIQTVEARLQSDLARGGPLPPRRRDKAENYVRNALGKDLHAFEPRAAVARVVEALVARGALELGPAPAERAAASSSSASSSPPPVPIVVAGVPDAADRVVARLRTLGEEGRLLPPRRRDKLTNFAANALGLADPDSRPFVDAVVEQMARRGVICLEGDAVAYPESSPVHPRRVVVSAPSPAGAPRTQHAHYQGMKASPPPESLPFPDLQWLGVSKEAPAPPSAAARFGEIKDHGIAPGGPGPGAPPPRPTLGDFVPTFAPATPGAAGDEKHAKAELHELLQKRGLPPPVYQLVGESGPPHARTFEVLCFVQGQLRGRGKGPSKGHAERAAAIEARANPRLLEGPAAEVEQLKSKVAAHDEGFGPLVHPRA